MASMWGAVGHALARARAGSLSFLLLLFWGSAAWAQTAPQVTRLEPGNLVVRHGSTGLAQATLSPAPTRAGTLTLSSSDPAVASVPARLAYAAGQTQVAIPITGEDRGQAQITVDSGGSRATMSANVVPAPSRLVALQPSQATIEQGAFAQFTIGVHPKRSNGSLTISVASSDPAKLGVPASVTIPAGQGTTTFSVRALAIGDARFTVSLQNAGVATNASASVRIVPVPPTVSSLTPATSQIRRDAQTQLTVRISAAQSATTTVALNSIPSGVVGIPASVGIPAGETEAAIPVTGLAEGAALVMASLNGSSAQSAVQVLPYPPALASMQPATTTLVVSAQQQFTVKLSAAQTTTVTAQLSAQPAGIVQVPADVVFAPGQTEASFGVTGVAPGQGDVVAVLGASVRRSRVTVTPQPAQLASLLPNPLGLQQGATGQLMLRLSAAPFEPVTATLSSSQPGVVLVPADVSFAAGQIEQSVTVQGVAVGSAQVMASLNGTTVSTTVNVAAPPPLIGLLEPPTQDLPKGKLGRIRVTLDRAPLDDAVIAIANDNASAVHVAAQATAAAGQTTLEIPVAALALGQGRLTLTLNGGSAQTVVQVVDPAIIAIAVQPASISIGPGEVTQLTATGTYSDNSTRDVTASASTSWSSGTATVATVSADGKVTGQQQGMATITAAQAVAPTWSEPEPSPVAGTAAVTVTAPAALALSAGNTTLTVGQTATVSITTPYPATTATNVTLAVSGTGGLQVPSSAVIGAGLTSANVVVTASAAGSPVLTARASPYAAGQLGFTVNAIAVPTVRITGINPASAAPGAAVTITGAGFASPASGNTVTFWGNVPAIVQSGSGTQLVVTVPDAAQTGAITVANTAGSAQSELFTVIREQDFGIQASPAYLKVMQGANAVAQLNLNTSGTRPYQGLAQLSASGLPAGTQASFSPATVSAYQTGKLVITASDSAPLGTASIVVRAQATLDGLPWVRESRINVEVIARANVTGVKGRFVTPGGAGIAGVIVRQGETTNQVVTDAAGNFLITGLAGGVTTLRFDATPANSLYPIWPYNVTVQAGEVQTMADWVINPPPTDDKFKPIANAAQDQAITDERYPGFAITLPAGVTITGWDGVKKTRIAVERIDPDKLPVGAPPFPMKEAYQLYFGTPMGGIPSSPIPVTLPNVADKEPGEKVEIWWFDGSPMGGTGEWKMAGLGTVSADGKTVSSDPGVGIPRFCGVCGLLSLSCAPPPPKPPQTPPTCPAPAAGNPVDLYTGQEMASVGGLTCRGITPIETGMKYNPIDAFNNRAGTITSFGYGWTFDYDISFLPFDGVQKRLVLPGGQFVNMVDDGTGKYRPADDPRFGGTYAQSAGSGKWEVVLKGGTKWLFEPFAGITGLIRGGPPLFLTRITDSNGNATTVARQSNGRISTIGGADGRAVNLAYGANGFASTVTDHTGRRETYEYTGSERVSRITDAMNRVTEYTYHPLPVYRNTYTSCTATNSSGQCTQSSSRVVTACETDLPEPSFQGLASIKYPTSDVPTVNTYGTDRILRQTTSSGQEWKFSYRRSGACVVKALDTARVSSGVHETWSFTCKAGQPLVTSTCAGGQCTQAVTGLCPEVDSEESRAAGWRFYGGTNVETRVTKPDGRQTVVKFNARGMPVEEIDEAGQSTRKTYDGKQQLVKVTDPLGRETRYEYDAFGNETAVVDPLGRRTETAYHGTFSKPTSMTRFLLGVPSTQGGQQLSYTPVIQTTTYDGRGNAIAMQDPTGVQSQIGYDAKGQISTITLPALASATSVPVIAAGTPGSVAKNARKLTLGYNAAGDIASITDAQNNESKFTADALGRPRVSTDPLNYATKFEYNNLDQPTKVTNALEKDSVLGYDSAARLTSVGNEAGVTVEGYGYDANGRVNRITDALNQSTNIVYDESGRPSRITDRKGQVTTVSYNERGDISQIAKPGHTVGFQYDAVGRLIEVRDAASVTTYQHDVANRITQMDTTTAAGSHRLQYEFDSLDRVTRRTLTGTSILVPDVTTYTWDHAGRIASHVTSTGGQTHATRYEYDTAGRLAARKVQAGAQQDTITQRYGYDTAERLAQIRYVKAEGTTSEQHIEQIDYSYDAKGQRTAKTALNNNSMGGHETPMTATYDAANRMTSVTIAVGGGTKTYTLGYDPNGNLTQKQNTADPADKAIYTWDANDRLIGLTQADLNATFSYDAWGRRIQAAITRGGQAAQTVQYLYEGDQMLGEVRDGKLSHRLLSGLALDESIARMAITANGQKDAAGSRIYLTDALNSVIAQLTDDNNAQAATGYGYSPYGEVVTVGPDGTSNSIQYTSRENDGAGLYFYRARYYDPPLKRFISMDPIGLNGGLNVFGYVSGNPLNFTDPTGLQKTLDEMLGPDYKDIPYPPDYPVIPRRPVLPPLPPPPSEPPNGGEPWPGADDWRGQCSRLYTACVTQKWTGNCGACLNKCTAQQEWPFQGPGACHPRRRRNANMCSIE